MFNKSIAYRLSIFISIAVIGVFVAIIIVSYLFNSKYVNESIKDKAIGLSNELIMKVEKPLITTRELSSNISKQIIFYGQNKHPEDLITYLMEKYPFINSIIINIDNDVSGLEEHNYYSYRENDSIIFESHTEKFYHCLSEKSIVENISKKEEQAWTEVFLCQRDQSRVVASYSPIRLKNENNRKIGYVICEVSLNNLNDIVNNIKVGKHGFTFLLSKNGRFITHPLKEFVLQKTIFSASEGAFNSKKINLKKILDKGLSGAFVAYPKFLNREKHWVYYTQLNEIKWTVIFAMPYNQLFRPLYISILKMLLISVIGIIVIYLLIKYITNLLLNPLSEVTDQLKKFTNEAGNIEINSLDEIKLVSESLNTLKSGYERYKIKQSEEEKKNQRQMQDLLQASEIQQSLIKTDFSVFSKIKEIDLFAIYKPARIVSGDLFDFFFDNNDNLIFTMGDVSGKGVSAAFFMSVAQTIIKSSARKFKSAGEIVKNANNELHTTNKHQFFLTLFLGILNIKTGELNYCNAAHTPTYVLSPTGEVVELDQSHGLPLGLYPNKEYADAEITLQPGDSILLYTDGITELRNENDLHFGNERFVENLQNLVELNPKELIRRVEQSVELFKGEAPQTDDITLMNIRYNA